MAVYLRENEDSRQTQQDSWHEVDTTLDHRALLAALDAPKEISASYGLNDTIHMGWRLGGPHMKVGKPDVQDYAIAQSTEGEVPSGPMWYHLFRWLIAQAQEIIPYDSVYIITDNCDLVGPGLHTSTSLAHWPVVAAWWRERIQFIGPYRERTTVVFVPICGDTGLTRVHPTWAGTYILDACVFLFPTINFALIERDCVPVTLFELEELWRSSECLPQHDAEMEQAHPSQRSPVAPAHKRARSADTRRTAQHQGPPLKLSKSQSAENLARLTPDSHLGGQFTVHYRASDDKSSAASTPAPPTSPVASPDVEDAAASSPPAAATCPATEILPATGILLVSEACRIGYGNLPNLGGFRYPMRLCAYVFGNSDQCQK